MRRRPWLRWSGAALVTLTALSTAFSLSLRTGPLQRYLTARLEAAFGRPMEVGKYSFSLLSGLRLEADSVTVAEDPRFGYEYFLRAERLTAGLRWMSLLQGRFEFGTLWFTRPSLNLVRAADGHWNVESWLPPSVAEPPATGAEARNVSAAPAPGRLYRIEISGGRINFKFGLDKHPFALAEVSGRLEQESAGRWSLDIAARPIRAAVTLQEAGTLRLRGRIAGTSARLQPADLTIFWQDVSLADALRLAKGQDFGAWGRFMAVANARTEAPSAGDSMRGTRWKLNAAVRLLDFHRWDLPHRPSDPAVNVLCEGEWTPGAALLTEPRPAVEFNKCTIEAPHSKATAKGSIQWRPGLVPEFQIASTWLDWGDLFAWYRVLHPGVPDNLVVEGHAGLNLSLRGWPPSFEEGEVTSDGARLAGAGLRLPLRLSSVQARARSGRLELGPLTLGFITPATPPAGEASAAARAPRGVTGDLLRWEGSIGPGAGGAYSPSSPWSFELGLEGQTSRAEDWLAAARVLGYTPLGGWSVQGPAAVRLRWRGSVQPFAAQRAGAIDLRGVQLRASYINLPITELQARVEVQSADRRVTLVAAQAFGARWKGTLRRTGVPSADASASPPAWEFDLAADHLDAQELDRWLGPRARPSLFERLLPFAASNPQTADGDAVLARLRGQGRLSVDDFALGSLEIKRLHAEVEMAGRSIRVHKAEADLYKGAVRGELEAELGPQPAYRFVGEFDGVNLGLLADATPALKGRFAGTAAGKLFLNAKGVGRDNLLASLDGHGTLRFRNVKLRGLDMRESYRAAAARSGGSDFPEAAVSFTLGAGEVQIDKLEMMASSSVWFVAQGLADFSPTVDLRVRALPADAPPGPGGDPSDSPELSPYASRGIRIRGPLDALQVSLIPGEVPKSKPASKR